MMTRMIRPCTLPAHWKQSPFDAMAVRGISYGMQTVHISLPHGIISYQANTGLHPTGDKLYRLFREAITTIAEALNAPVQATNEVLDAMNKVPEANFLMRDDYDNLVECRYDSKWRMREINGVYLPVGAWLYTKVQEYSPSFSSEKLAVDDLIQADCPLALEVLLQFYIDGTPVVVK